MTEKIPGWEAIDRALDRLYPSIEPRHYGTLIKWMLGGPDPLDGVSFYPREDPVPHWHVVTYGMSELYTKESENLAESGWGFEFTFRVRRAPADTEPPMWAANFLQNLARYVFQTGNWFEPGHHMDLNGPIMLDHETQIRAVAFTEDPELGTIDTPHGIVRFLQVVGITPGEYAAIQAWNTTALLDLAAQHLPLLVTDLGRSCLTEDPSVAAAIEEGRRRDGSSTSGLTVSQFSWSRDGDKVRLFIGAHIATGVANLLRGRLPFGNPMELRGPDSAVRILAGEVFSWSVADAGPLEITLPEQALDGLIDALVPRAGARTVAGAPDLVVEITLSEIRDAAGEVVRTVG